MKGGEGSECKEEDLFAGWSHVDGLNYRSIDVLLIYFTTPTDVR